MIKLFINNRQVDIDSKTKANITYALSDINNPTTIKSDYTKSISVPMTANNREIFGHLNRFDSTSKLYNASKRYDCELRYNGDMVIKGYVKLEDITDSFNITIYGQIGEFFKSLEDKKIIAISPKLPDLTHTLNRDFVKENWNHENDINGESIHDYIAYGFGYTGLYDDFNSSYVQTDTGKNNPGLTDEEIEDIIFIENPEDVDEHQMRLYMSYGQRRGFYVNKLFKSIINNSGYDIEYSETFFNANNPYWKDAVVFFNKEKTIEKERLNFYTDPIEVTVPQNGPVSPNPVNLISDIPFNKTVNGKYLDANGYLDINKLDIAFSHLIADVDVDIVIDQIQSTGLMKAKINSILNNYFNIHVKNLTYNDPIESGDYEQITYLSGIVPGLKWEVNAAVTTTFQETPLYKPMIINQQVKPGDVITINNRFNTRMAYLGNTGTLRFKADLIKLVEGAFTNIGCRVRLKVNTISLDLVDEESFRSGAAITANQILANNATQKDFILNYMKMFDLHIVLDKYQKKGKILTRNEFYKDYKVDNWDDLLDESKKSTIVPVTFDTKYISLNYKEGKTNFDKSYKDVWDRVYGEARIDTGYEFKEDPLDSIKSMFSTPVIAQDRSWEFEGRVRKGSTRDDKIMMYSCDKKGNVRERLDNGIQIYFRNGLLPCKEYQITDDTKDMIKYDKFCHNWTFKDGKAGEAWTDGVNIEKDGRKQFYYRQFSSISKDGRCSLDFRRPAEIFFEGTYPDNICIYDLFWDKYVEDKYNVDNKLLTAYFVIPKSYMLAFTFDRFIYLGGQYWSISRVVDFDPNKTESLMVELVQVKNINNYINSQEFPWLKTKTIRK